jgi:hypothetical protein
LAVDRSLDQPAKGKRAGSRQVASSFIAVTVPFFSRGWLFSPWALRSHGDLMPCVRRGRCVPYPPPRSAQVGLQEPSVGVRVAADAAGALVREPLPVGSRDRPPHLRPRREAKPAGEHGGDPFSLGLHHRE